MGKGTVRYCPSNILVQGPGKKTKTGTCSKIINGGWGIWYGPSRDCFRHLASAVYILRSCNLEGVLFVYFVLLIVFSWQFNGWLNFELLASITMWHLNLVRSSKFMTVSTTGKWLFPKGWLEVPGNSNMSRDSHVGLTWDCWCLTPGFHICGLASCWVQCCSRVSFPKASDRQNYFLILLLLQTDLFCNRVLQNHS